MSSEALKRLVFRLTETAFSVNPNALRDKYKGILAPLLYDRTKARRLLILAHTRLAPTQERHTKRKERLLLGIERFLEATR